MSEQLNLLGEPDQPQDGDLGPVQREVMRELRRVRTLAVDEAGAIAHEHRGAHQRGERCWFCGSDGAPVLASLVERGLAERAPEGAIQLPRPKPIRPAYNEFPEGF